MNKEFFANEMNRLYEAFNKDYNSSQAKEYYDRFQMLSDTQIHEVVSSALDEISKFPTRADLVKICRSKGFFEQKVAYTGKSPFVLFVCYCGGQVALKRDMIDQGMGEFACPNVKYRKPVEWSAQIAEAEAVLTNKRVAATKLPAVERDRVRQQAYEDFIQKKHQLQHMMNDAPPMCTRKYDYGFIKKKCKEDKTGAIVMADQKIVEDDPMLFDVPTGTAAK